MEQEPTGQKKQKPYNSYLKYSGLSIQFLAVIGLAVYAGYRLDAYLALQFPAFTLLFAMLALGGMIYKLYRTITKI